MNTTKKTTEMKDEKLVLTNALDILHVQYCLHRYYDIVLQRLHKPHADRSVHAGVLTGRRRLQLRFRWRWFSCLGY